MSISPFKLILSRKGFDSASGGCASPIFPNGRLYSLPINYEPSAKKRYSDLGIDAGLANSHIGSVVEQLTKGKVKHNAFAHFDPDLDEQALPRQAAWRAAFGQAEAAQIHLANQGIGVGDVFLFHGWFRAVQLDQLGHWHFSPKAPNRNIIFGWLQVGEIIDVAQGNPDEILTRNPWLCDHPHVRLSSEVKLSPVANTIYIASERLRLAGTPTSDVPGAGVFRCFDPNLVLTDTATKNRSVWRLPQWFKGGDTRPWLTQFPRPEWWTDAQGDVVLRPVGRQGQEAVLECSDRSEAAPWLDSLIRSVSTTGL